MKKLVIFGIPVLFFLVSFLTLNDYGINWDDFVHYSRGQAYFHYLTTGKTTYDGNQERRSYFQNDSFNGEYFLKIDSAHPPTGDIFSASFNYIFYQKINLLGDIQSYHFFIIFISSLAILAVTAFAYEEIGIVGALVAGAAFATYPLFFGESHFNIKDPVETAFFTLTIFSFWKSLQKGNWKWLLASLVFCAFALGTKFNVVFLPFILIPYLFIRYWKYIKSIKFGFKKLKKVPVLYKTILIFSPFVVLLIFYLLWPFLWKSPIKNLIDAIGYYKGIGIGGSNDTRYLIFGGINLYPLYWIIVTTPPMTLLFSALGILGIFANKKLKTRSEILWLFWFFVPIARVTMPDVTIYGGVRQIMEFIPAMSLLAGFGASILSSVLRSHIHVSEKLILLIFSVAFIPQILILRGIHPNENVYFNFLVGGPSGAVKQNIPYWGNSFGNVYWQVIQWLNKNAEPSAKLALVQGTGSNIALPQLRSDLNFANSNWSGIFRNGEYLFEMIYGGMPNAYPYAWEYVNKVLKPVYEVEVGGVFIAKVWKNDLDHTNDEYKKPEIKIWDYRFSENKNELNVVFNQEESVTRLFLHYGPNKNCSGVSANVETSLDGKNWKTELETMPNIQVAVPGIGSNISPFFFAARKLRYLKINVSDSNSCLLGSPYFEFWALSK